ncbi:MAG: amidase [Chloroflexi bacterium]|nr:amidase [Chloroflexota bacterium]
MSDTVALEWTPAHKLREMIANKHVSPVELTLLALARAESLNPKLNAFLTLIPEMALEQAKAAEQAVMNGDDLGPLHGIPISIKDLEGVKGVRQTNGSLVYKDNVSPADALPTHRIREAGAIIIGKTNTSEFGHIGTNENRLGDACRNPWNLDCTSGASSGGAGASVAAGITSLAQGSDGGGSVRIPSAICGIFGIKPSQGRAPRRDEGITSWNPISFSNVGPMTRDVRDAAMMLQVISGPSPNAEPVVINEAPPDFVASLERGVSGMRIAWSPDLGGSPVDPEVCAAAEKAARAFEAMGATVETPEFKLGDSEDVFWTFQAHYRSRAYAVNGQMLEDHRDMLSDYFIEGLEGGKATTAAQLWMAEARINQYRHYTTEFFSKYDLLLTPSLASTAFPINQHPEVLGGRPVAHKLWGFTPFTYPFNMTGNPAATVPIGLAENGLPMGLQIVGAFGDEPAIFAAAAAFESAHPWADHRPPNS